MDFDTKKIQLDGYLLEIEKKFITTHIANSLATPVEYNLDVKSYCILCHAAFEEFIEFIALQTMSLAIKKYQQELKISKPLISLMHFKGNHGNYLDKDQKNLTIDKIETAFDYTRKQLAEIKDVFSKDIFGNHGISLKYMRNLLMPVSVDIPNDINWANSLERLANERGSYAHKYLESAGRVKQSIDPSTAKTIVSDCAALCEEIKNRAKVLV